MSGFSLGSVTVICGILLVICGYKLCECDHVSLAELRESGYEVVRHSETHGSCHTNWVEVMRKDGKPL